MFFLTSHKLINLPAPVRIKKKLLVYWETYNIFLYYPSFDTGRWSSQKLNIKYSLYNATNLCHKNGINIIRIQSTCHNLTGDSLALLLGLAAFCCMLSYADMHTERFVTADTEHGTIRGRQFIMENSLIDGYFGKWLQRSANVGKGNFMFIKVCAWQFHKSGLHITRNYIIIPTGCLIYMCGWLHKLKKKEWSQFS